MRSTNLSSNMMERVAARCGTTVAGLTAPKFATKATTSGFDHITESLCRVRVTIANATGVSSKDLLRSVNDTMGSGIVAVAGTFQPIAELGNGVVEYVGLITKGLHTKQVATASLGKNFTTVAKNVLMDNTDEQVWNLVSESNGATVLARNVEESLGELVAIARISNTQNRDFRNVLVAQAGTAQYASFYNPSTGTVDYGYVCGTEASGQVVIASRSLGDLIGVDDRHIVTSTNIHADVAEYNIHKDLHSKGIKCPSFLLAGMREQVKEQGLGLTRNSAVSAFTSQTPLDSEKVSYTDLRNYYKQIFAYAPEYYKEFEKIIQDHGF